MSSTAHEDQFTDAPEPVRQPYDAGSILRRNVADLELALKQQTERAEAAEAELAKLREQVPVAMISKNDAGQISIKNPDGSFFDISKNVGRQFYAAHAPAVADLEIALRKQTERAESAEAELAKAREHEREWCAQLCEWLPVRTGYEGKTFAEAIRGEGLGAKLAGGFIPSTLLKITAPVPAVSDKRVDELAMLIRRLVRRLNQELPHNDIGEAAMDYLARNGISGEILRGWAAPAVPKEWREVMAELVAIAEKKGKKQGSPNHSHQRPGIWDDDNGPVLSGNPCAECAMYDKARALLQSTEVTK